MTAARISIAKLAAAALLFTSVGCHSKSSATPQNFITGLNAHFLDHPECLSPVPSFPYETGDPAKIKQLNSLVDAKLLDGKMDFGVRTARFTVTDFGTRYAPRFCYGHRVVDSITSFTPPTPRNGFPETDVVYQYHVEDVPVWAKSDEVRQAFPEMAKATTGTSNAKATLAGTMAGWQVPD